MLQHLSIILASKSPRRQELLTLLGLNFEVVLKDVDESYPDGLTPAEIAVHISEKKAKAFEARDEIVITADTIVSINEEILGKPSSTAHARQMLRKLSGRKHEVFTGVTVINGQEVMSFYDQTTVYCRDVTDEEIDFYIENYQPFDKAGSYGIQDWWGNAVVERLEGSYTNVMGLPTEKLYGVLQKIQLS